MFLKCYASGFANQVAVKFGLRCWLLCSFGAKSDNSARDAAAASRLNARDYVVNVLRQSDDKFDREKSAF